MTNSFSPVTRELFITWPLPPPDNRLHRSSQYGRYPTREYADWLEIVAPSLDRVLGSWAADTERWWNVFGTLRIGSSGDPTNYIKAVLDALTGSRYDRENRKIVRAGGLFNDDRRVNLMWDTEYLRHPEPHVQLWVAPAGNGHTPLDWRAEQVRKAKLEREAKRAIAQAAKAEKAAKKRVK